MAKKRAKKNETPPLRFDKKLVLNQWMLSLFEVSSFDKLAKNLKSLKLDLRRVSNDLSGSKRTR